MTYTRSNQSPKQKYHRKDCVARRHHRAHGMILCAPLNVSVVMPFTGFKRWPQQTSLYIQTMSAQEGNGLRVLQHVGIKRNFDTNSDANSDANCDADSDANSDNNLEREKMSPRDEKKSERASKFSNTSLTRIDANCDGRFFKVTRIPQTNLCQKKCPPTKMSSRKMSTSRKNVSDPLL